MIESRKRGRVASPHVRKRVCGDRNQRCGPVSPSNKEYNGLQDIYDDIHRGKKRKVEPELLGVHAISLSPVVGTETAIPCGTPSSETLVVPYGRTQLKV